MEGLYMKVFIGCKQPTCPSSGSESIMGGGRGLGVEVV